MKPKITLAGWIRSIAIIITVCSAVTAADPDGGQSEWRRIVDLRGHWKFEIGDNAAWAAVDFDDSNWGTVFVPSHWEEEGYPGYDGYAWYRQKFDLPAKTDNKSVYLRLGTIDDVDQVYINGRMVGFNGSFPPEYYTAFHVERRYLIPQEVLVQGGKNTIAVRVFDEGMGGGIIGDHIGLFLKNDEPELEVNLAGQWKLFIGDDSEFSAVGFDDREWQTIQAPAPWETQGLQDYDGIAWYRKKFMWEWDSPREDLVLLLGRIDDFDEAYLNGQQIGRTGRIRKRIDRDDLGDAYLELRAYDIPQDLLRRGQDNVIAVRVYDGWLHGGIYDGPVGIISRKNYRHWSSEMRVRPNLFNIFKSFWEEN